MTEPLHVQSVKNPVILIHGFIDSELVFIRMGAFLRERGWTVYHPNLHPSDGRQGLEILSQQVANFVRKVIPRGQAFDMVGFSMGGIVARYYIQRLGGIKRVHRLVTIGTPHQGTWLSFAWINTGCQQMRPNSAFLVDLNSDVDKLSAIEVTSIWTPLDFVIVPPESSVLPIGTSISIPVPVHFVLARDLRCLLAVETALSTPPKTAPTGI